MASRKLHRYCISAEVTVSIHTYVEAGSAKEAIANCSADMPHLCHQCATNDGDGQWSLSGELDGEPRDLRAEIEDP